MLAQSTLTRPPLVAGICLGSIRKPYSSKDQYNLRPVAWLMLRFSRPSSEPLEDASSPIGQLIKQPRHFADDDKILRSLLFRRCGTMLVLHICCFGPLGGFALPGRRFVAYSSNEGRVALSLDWERRKCQFFQMANSLGPVRECSMAPRHQDGGLPIQRN